jgi:hypothetical protein
MESKSSSVDVPPQYGCLLHDTLFAEIADKEVETERIGFSRKIGRWIQKNGMRSWIGRHWEDISGVIENRPTKRATMEDVITRKYTRGMRNCINEPDQFWEHFLSPAQQVVGLTEYHARQESFVQLCEEFRDWVNKQPGKLFDKVPKDDEEMRKWIQDPTLTASFVPARFKPRKKFQDVGWREHLTHFPDRLAVGRWGRIIAYYAMLMARGLTHKFKNNWDDANYLFLASYSHHLITSDTGLIKAARMMFPGMIKIVSPEPISEAPIS